MTKSAQRWQGKKNPALGTETRQSTSQLPPRPEHTCGDSASVEKPMESLRVGQVWPFGAGSLLPLPLLLTFPEAPETQLSPCSLAPLLYWQLRRRGRLLDS